MDECASVFWQVGANRHVYLFNLRLAHHAQVDFNQEDMAIAPVDKPSRNYRWAAVRTAKGQRRAEKYVRGVSKTNWFRPN
jgi:hypothetical protein